MSGTERLDDFQTEAGTEFILGDFNGRVSQYHLSRPETWLKISFRSQTKLGWADYGHEIAWAEFRLDNSEKDWIPSLPASLPSPRVNELGGSLRIHGSNYLMVFDPFKARLLTWSYRGIDLFAQDAGPRLTFWRAPTDNDKPSAANVWRGWRLQMMTQEVRSVKHQYVEESGKFEIIVKSWVAPKVLAWGFESSTTYIITREGSLSINVHLTPKGSTPSILPRVGLEMMLPADRTVAQWLGLGPGQTYKDMKQAGKVGVWKRNLEDMMVNFDMPQENGNRTETRWVKVTDERGIGLKAILHRQKPSDHGSSQHGKSPSTGTQSSDSQRSSAGSWELVQRPKELSDSQQRRPGFDFAVSKYTAEELDRAQHPHELRCSNGVNFRIDDDHHGLGSASCGPDTLEKYQLKMKELDFTVVLEAVGT